MSQFNDPTFGNPPPPPRSSGMKWVLIVLVVLGLLALVCCGGCAAFTYWGYTVGAKQAGLEVAAQVEDDPAVQEHLGDNLELMMNLSSSTQEQQQRGRQVLVFDATGSKGSGTIIVFPNPGGGPGSFESAILKLPDGKELPLE